MKRLPSYDVQTSQVERGAFLGLSLVAVALISIAAADSARFASQTDRNALPIPPKTTALVQIRKKDSTTNLTMFETTLPVESARMNGFTKPKS
jgi:hypothetical protein